MPKNAVIAPALRFILLCTLAGSVVTPAQNPPAQTIAIRAGRLFDPRSGANLIDQMVLVQGDRITDVGPAGRLSAPAGARIIDLSRSTVLPGLIDGHVHTLGGPSGLQYQMMLGLANAQRDLNAGFTTIVDMGSHGGWFGTVELRKAIDSSLIMGPRMRGFRTCIVDHTSGEHAISSEPQTC